MANAVTHHENHVTHGPASGAPAPAALTPSQRRSEAQQAEARDSLAELLERSRAIARQASSTLVSAFKDAMADPAVAGGFAVESARDLVQYLLRRGELTPGDADRLLKAAEGAAQKTSVKRVAPAKPAPAKPAPAKLASAKSAPAKASPLKSATKPAAAARKAAPAAKKPEAPAKKTVAKPRVKKGER
jgi:hypothetical protein